MYVKFSDRKRSFKLNQWKENKDNARKVWNEVVGIEFHVGSNEE
ncbi:hypothetical protein [Dyadobacter psychrotolerans]|nr:hypothetical protein [Dyadobacter psychrotolerans]